MTDADVRKRCEELVNKMLGLTHRTPGQQMARVGWVFALYCSAYADGQRDGMERAADRIIQAHKSTDSDKWLDIASELKTQAANGAQINQAAGEGV